MPGKPPPRQVTREREKRAWELRQQFKTGAQIAEILGMSESGVCRALQRVERRTLEALQESVEQLKMEQTMRLEHICQEAMNSWRQSKEDGRESPIGDVRFLGEARSALKDIRSIWGAEAPAKVAPTSPDGREPYRLEVQNMSDAELELLERIVAQQDCPSITTIGQSSPV